MAKTESTNSNSREFTLFSLVPTPVLVVDTNYDIKFANGAVLPIQESGRDM